MLDDLINKLIVFTSNYGLLVMENTKHCFIKLMSIHNDKYIFHIFVEDNTLSLYINGDAFDKFYCKNDLFVDDMIDIIKQKIKEYKILTINEQIIKDIIQ